MSAWHFYALETGLFTGRWIDCPTDHVQANTPEGCGAAQGVADWQAQCVDLQTGQVIDWQPPAPASDAMRTWSWSEQARRWIAVPTQAAHAAAARAERDRLLADCDWRVTRAAELGQPVPASWATYRQALRDVPTQVGFPQQVEWPQAPAE